MVREGGWRMEGEEGVLYISSVLCNHWERCKNEAIIITHYHRRERAGSDECIQTVRRDGEVNKIKIHRQMRKRMKSKGGKEAER